MAYQYKLGKFDVGINVNEVFLQFNLMQSRASSSSFCYILIQAAAAIQQRLDPDIAL